MPPPLIWIIAGWYLALNAIAFAAFALDKRAARRGEWRTSERTLLGLALLGGFLGAWGAMRMVRHKTQKLAFRFTVPAAGVLHLALWAVVAFRALGR